MMRATPIVAEQFPQRARDGADNVLFKERKDGLARLLITGANSPASLSQVTVEFLVEDDLSKWEPNSAGDPETQADNRARAIEFAKILKISHAAGAAGLQDHAQLRAWLEGNAVRAVPALRRNAGPRMGQHARRSRSRAPGATRASPASPAAASSRSTIGRKCSPASNGARRIAAARREHRSFYIWSAYSYLQSWSRIAQEWLKARGDPGAEQTFICDTVGKAYRAQGESAAMGDVARSRCSVALHARHDPARRAAV